jgi:hypothetical protein
VFSHILLSWLLNDTVNIEISVIHNSYCIWSAKPNLPSQNKKAHSTQYEYMTNYRSHSVLQLALESLR